MSGNIPFEIQVEIIKRLPMKTLIQFRSVSKPWKSLIDSSRFIADYSGVQHLLVKYEEVRNGAPFNYEQKYVSIVDDDSFPQQKVSLTVPLLVKMLKSPRIISSSHGLVCLYSSSSEDGRRTDVAVLWNIGTRKAVAVGVPNVGVGVYGTALGFGVCRETTDPKIVKIKYIDHNRSTDIESVTCIPYQVEVFTLSTGTWRSPYGNLPRKAIHFSLYNEVVVDGVCYWLATDSMTMDDGYRLIVSFDMTSEVFREVTLPVSVEDVFISSIGDSLVVCGQDEWDSDLNCCVWMMEGDVSKSFKKIFTVTIDENAMLNGFRLSGEPIIEIPEQGQGHERGRLFVFKPYSKQIYDLGIDGVDSSFYLYPYMETLLLLDQPDLMVYNKGKRHILSGQLRTT